MSERRSGAPGEARLREDVTLHHRPSLGQEARPVRLERGQPVTVLQRWERQCLCRDGDGRFFHIPNELLEGLLEGPLSSHGSPPA